MANGSCFGSEVLQVRPLTSVDALLFKDLVFASLRGRLFQLGRDANLFGVAAECGSEPAGAAVAEVAGDGRVRVLSLFVLAARRGLGLGSAMLRALEEKAASLVGEGSLTLSYLAPRPATAAVEATLRAAGWEEPESSMLLCKAMSALEPWALYRGKEGSSPNFALFPWHELTEEDQDWIDSTQREKAWIPPDLYPLQFAKEELEPINSLGIRHGGRPVGWVLTHRTAPDSIRFTTSFIHRDHQRGLHILPAYREAVRLQQVAGIPFLTWMVPWEHKGMAGWVLKRWPKDLIQVDEMRLCRKPLPGSAVRVQEENFIHAVT